MPEGEVQSREEYHNPSLQSGLRRNERGYNSHHTGKEGIKERLGKGEGANREEMRSATKGTLILAGSFYY